MTEHNAGGPLEGSRTRALAEGALLAALAVVLVVAATLIPPLFILSFVAPAPLVVAVVRHGLRMGLLAGAVAGVLLAVFLGLQALPAGLTLVATGVGLGNGLRRRWSIEAVLGLGTLVSLGAILVSLWISLQVAGIDLIDMILTSTQASYQRSLELWQQIYERMGTNVDIAPIEAELERVMELLPLLVPGILVGTAAVTSFANYVAAAAPLRRLGNPVPELPPFARWQLPPAAVYALVGVFVILRGVEQLGGQIPSTVLPALMSTAWLLQVAVMVNGLATAYFFLRRWRLGKGFAVVLLVFGFLNPWFQALFFWLGFLEPLLQVRVRVEQRENRSGGDTNEGDPADGS